MKNYGKKKLSLEKIQISKIKDLENITGGGKTDGWSVLLERCDNGGGIDQIKEDE